MVNGRSIKANLVGDPTASFFDTIWHNLTHFREILGHYEKVASTVEDFINHIDKHLYQIAAVSLFLGTWLLMSWCSMMNILENYHHTLKTNDNLMHLLKLQKQGKLNTVNTNYKIQIDESLNVRKIPPNLKNITYPISQSTKTSLETPKVETKFQGKQLNVYKIVDCLEERNSRTVIEARSVSRIV